MLCTPIPYQLSLLILTPLEVLLDLSQFQLGLLPHLPHFLPLSLHLPLPLLRPLVALDVVFPQVESAPRGC